MMFPISHERGDDVFIAKSRANRNETFDRPTSFKTAYVAEARSKMGFRVESWNPKLCCLKLDTLTSK